MKRQIQDRLQEPQLFSVILKYLDDYENINITDFMTSPGFDPYLVDNILSFWSIDIHNNSIIDAVRHDDVYTLKTLIEAVDTDPAIIKQAIREAILNGNIDSLQYLISYQRIMYPTDIMRVFID